MKVKKIIKLFLNRNIIFLPPKKTKILLFDTNLQESINKFYNGDFEAACKAIQAKTILMPCKTDLYFPVADNEIQASLMSNTELRPIPSDWGHIAGAPGLNPVDSAFIDNAHRELLAS